MGKYICALLLLWNASFCFAREGDIKIFKLPIIEIEAGSEYVLPVDLFLPKTKEVSFSFAGQSFVLPRYDEKSRSIIIKTTKDKIGIDSFRMLIEEDKKKKTQADVVVRVRKEHKTTVRFTPEDKAKKVFIAGDFNNWSQTATPLKGPSKDGDYLVELKLPPGSYSYKFVVDGKWISDPSNPEKTPDGFGGFNSVLKIGAKTVGRWCTVSKSDEELKLIYLLDENIPPIDPSTIKILTKNKLLPTEKYQFFEENQVLIIKEPFSDDISINAQDLSGEILPEFVVKHPNSERSVWDGSIMYFAFIDRFFNGDPTNDKKVPDPEVEDIANYYGGDLQGIIDKINEGYFNKLGINIIWISPFIKNPEGAFVDANPPHKKFTGYHGYWPVSFWDVDERFGSIEKLKEFVAAAHKKNIKVIYDMVLNHIHEENPLYKEKAAWFSKLELPDNRKNIRLFDERPLDTWFDEFLPDIDYSNNPAAADYMIDNCIWWIKETGCDGFRLDAVKHMSVDFWIKLRRKIRQEVEIPGKKIFYMVGETISSREKIMEFVGYDKLDGQFDFPLYWPIKEVFAWETMGLDHLENERKKSEEIYGNHIMSSLLGNHDFARFTAFAENAITPSMDEKSLTWHNQPDVKKPETYKKLKLAFTFLMTQPGIPMIYYGDEIGLCGAGDPDNRRPMRFGKEVDKNGKDVMDYVSALNRFRAGSNAVKFGEHHTLLIGKDIYAYLKNYFGETVIVVLNRSGKTMTLSLDLPAFVKSNKFVDALTGKKANIKKIKLSPKSAVILREVS